MRPHKFRVEQIEFARKAGPTAKKVVSDFLLVVNGKLVDDDKRTSANRGFVRCVQAVWCSGPESDRWFALRSTITLILLAQRAQKFIEGGDRLVAPQLKGLRRFPRASGH